MNDSYYNNRIGFQEMLRKGMTAVSSFSRGASQGIGSREEQLWRLNSELELADAVVIGAGAGLSTSAGLTYSGERFNKYFYDFRERFGITDMYSGGFYPFPDEETRWAWWARHIYYNRYIDPPKPVYQNLLTLVRNKDYFVITTNVDHQFQRAGFDKKRLFYTQGDYGLFQSTDPGIRETYDNEEWVMNAMKAQGFIQDENGIFQVPESGSLLMSIPADMIPTASDGSSVTMNLRSDDTFVEDEGWHRAEVAYSDYISKHRNEHVLYLEIGIGANTPVIIKYPFWALTAENPNAVYACLNYSQPFCPKEIEDQSICIDGDCGDVIEMMM